MNKKLIILLMLFFTTSCGGGMYTQGKKVEQVFDTSLGDITVTKNAFILASDYPSDLVIPDIDGMRDTAFIVSLYSPSGVIAVDLTTDPYTVSSKFKGLISPDGTGYVNRLAIKSATRAFLLTSSHIIDFNPATGEVNTSVNIIKEITLKTARPLSAPYDVNGDGKKESTVKKFGMNFPGDIEISGSFIYVTMSNYISPTTPAVAAPGIVRRFMILDKTPYLFEYTDPLATTDFNPTAVTALPDGTIAVTNSGVSDIEGAAAHPKSNSSIDFIDPETNQIIDNISMGTSALSFNKLTVTPSGKTAYFSSISYGEVYAVDLENRTAIYSHNNPLTITGNFSGSDYITAYPISNNGAFLFISSFDNSALFPVDLSGDLPEIVTTISLGFPKGVTPGNPTGGNTGISDTVVRPGKPEIDFLGPDIFALTANPGTLVAINTHGGLNPSSNSEAPIWEDPETEEPVVEEVEEDAPKEDECNCECQCECEECEPCNGADPDDPENPEEVEILTEAPPGTDPFADDVFEFLPGEEAGVNKSPLPNPLDASFAAVLGPPDGKIISLGDEGEITLEMTDFIIADGDGPDFTVFENVFMINSNTPFSEPGTVSVSTDGITFFKFPCANGLENKPLYPGCAGIVPTYAKKGNGKDPTDPAVSGGDQFDLADVGLKTARFVKIKDSGEDPNPMWKGPLMTGFDLDAVAVINGALP